MPPCPSRNRFRGSTNVTKPERLGELYVDVQCGTLEPCPERFDAAITFERPDLAVGDAPQFVEHGTIATYAECCLDAGVRSHVLVEEPIGKLVQRVRFGTPPLDFPIGMQRIFAYQPGVLTVCADPPGYATLYRTIETQGPDPCRRMTSDRGRQQNGTMGMAVLGVDRNDVRLGDVCVPMGEIGAAVVDVVRHPPKRGGVIQLDVAMFEGRFFSSDLQAVAQQVGAVRFSRNEIRKGLPEAIGAAEVLLLVVRWQIKPCLLYTSDAADE